MEKVWDNIKNLFGCKSNILKSNGAVNYPPISGDKSELIEETRFIDGGSIERVESDLEGKNINKHIEYQRCKRMRKNKELQSEIKKEN